MIRFYYGLSGTFKGTTIKAELEKRNDCKVVWSMIKSWKNLETGIYSGMIDRNDLNYALLHLCILEHTIKNMAENSQILVERGVTDMAYYRTLMYDRFLDSDDTWIKNSVAQELSICKERPEKILLIQNDYDFIKNEVLKEPTRKEVFPGGLDDYLKNQEMYIEFTKKYNDITDTIVINNAKEYIEKLGLKYETY